jgi:hypothetical protein
MVELTWDMPLMRFVDATDLKAVLRSVDLYPFAFAALCRDYQNYTGFAHTQVIAVEGWLSEQIPYNRYSKFIIDDKWLIIEFADFEHAFAFKMRWL